MSMCVLSVCSSVVELCLAEVSLIPSTQNQSKKQVCVWVFFTIEVNKYNRNPAKDKVEKHR